MNNIWYNHRNKRTDSLVGVNNLYKDARIIVCVNSNVQIIGIQQMLLTTVNILSRWCSWITVLSNDGDCLVAPHKGSRSLLRAVEQIVRANDPQVHLSINETIWENDLCINIGQSPGSSDLPYITISATGWVASCAYNKDVPSDITEKYNPLSAAFAACLANAEAFRWCVGVREESYAKWYSLQTYDTSEVAIRSTATFNNNLDLGRVHLVGCGAIGSSFIYLLTNTNWTGSFMLADMDKKVELHNTSSSLLFSNDHVDKGHTKVDICSSFLDETKLKVSRFPDDYAKYKYDHRTYHQSADIILCFANDKNIWSTLQHLYPPVTIHATTSASWGVNIGRHIPFKDECIYCTFQGIMKTLYIPKCAEGILPVDTAEKANAEEKPAAILPFLSPVAAILTMVEVHKLYTQPITEMNSFQLNLGTAEGNFVSDFFEPFRCPVCRDQHNAVYGLLNNNTLFWPISADNNINKLHDQQKLK